MRSNHATSFSVKVKEEDSIKGVSDDNNKNKNEVEKLVHNGKEITPLKK